MQRTRPCPQCRHHLMSYLPHPNLMEASFFLLSSLIEPVVGLNGFLRVTIILDRYM